MGTCQQISSSSVIEGAVRSPAMTRRQIFLHGPILPTLLRLSWPNILVMLAQTSTGLIETWWISRLGTDALAGGGWFRDRPKPADTTSWPAFGWSSTHDGHDAIDGPDVLPVLTLLQGRPVV
jgi:hypothetical protein